MILFTFPYIVICPVAQTVKGRFDLITHFQIVYVIIFIGTSDVSYIYSHTDF